MKISLQEIAKELNRKGQEEAIRLKQWRNTVSSAYCTCSPKGSVNSSDPKWHQADCGYVLTLETINRRIAHELQELYQSWEEEEDEEATR